MKDSYSSLKHLLTSLRNWLLFAWVVGMTEIHPRRQLKRPQLLSWRGFWWNTTYLAQLTSDSSLSVLLQQAGVTIEDSVLFCLTDIWLDKVSGERILNNWLFDQLSGTFNWFYNVLCGIFHVVKWSFFLILSNSSFLNHSACCILSSDSLYYYIYSCRWIMRLPCKKRHLDWLFP